MFILPITLTTQNINEVREQLLSYLENGVTGEYKEIILDAAELHDIDIFGIQLLLSAFSTAEKLNYSLKLINIKPVVQQLFEVSGTADVIAMG